MEESDHLPEHSDRRVSPAGPCSAGDSGHGESLLQEDDLQGALC